MKMNAAVLTEYGKIEYQNVTAPGIKDNQVLIKVGSVGICGSDLHIYNGDFSPRTQTPMIQGHEFAGTIVEVGKNVNDYKIGDRVAVDPIIPCGQCAACKLGHYPACTNLKLLGVDVNGGFGEYVAADEHMLYRLTAKVPDKYGALVELYSIGFHACNRSGLQKDDTAVVWGSGRVGQVILQAARTKTKNTIFMVDVLDERLKIAASAYENVVTINANQVNPVEKIMDLTNGRGVDVAFESVGHARAVERAPHPVRGCVQSIRGAGTVCVLGLADEPAPLVMKELIWREARIVASRVSHGEFAEAIHHFDLGNLKPDAIVSAYIPAAEANDAFELLQTQPEKYLKIVMHF